MHRPMTFSDRQHFIQSLAICRNLSIACEQSDRHDSELRKRCEELIGAIDNTAGELVGDAGYFKVIDVESRA